MVADHQGRQHQAGVRGPVAGTHRLGLPVAWVTSNSGTLLSYGDNDIDANTNGNTAPPSTPHR